ncbi:hypothetical protein [Tabrizicola sp.]|uniref:hypothetical protein n=1 Tax=Tabrizicola sp. TaxID=2005166 RepID=UPI00286BF7A2|nr:hypothetical protein [Tabrizicola sp.]
MAIAEELRSIVEAFPQARVLAFADMTSRMVLCSAGGEALTQEYFEKLCKDAEIGFSDPMNALASDAFGDAYGSIMIEPTGVRLFMRSESQIDDVLCCVCDHGLDLGAFVARIRATLETISASA